MTTTDRRSFLKGATAAAAAAFTGAQTSVAAPDDSGKPWRKAYMLGGLKKGEVLERFTMLKDAGFEGVELTSPNNIDKSEILKARDQTGLVIHGVSGSQHWKDTLSDPKAEVVERGLSAVREELDDCKAYGGTTVLLVPAVVNKFVSYRDAYVRSQKNVRKLIPDAEKHGIKIAIEEVWNKFLLSPPEFARYIDEFQSPWIGAYFDVGNVVEYGFPQDWIHELGPRILKIHIKEYAKPKRFSYPLGEGGEIDWPAVRQALLDVGYKGWISAEVPLGDLNAMKDVVKRMNDVLGMG